MLGMCCLVLETVLIAYRADSQVKLRTFDFLESHLHHWCQEPSFPGSFVLYYCHISLLGRYTYFAIRSLLIS